jgi:gamma-glutamyltranspeptidase/glutathione hydrolase
MTGSVFRQNQCVAPLAAARRRPGSYFMKHPHLTSFRLAVAVFAAGCMIAPVRSQDPATGESHGPRPNRARAAHRPAVPGVHGLVTAGHPLASMAGIRVLLAGGNAFDAAVAILATLNVTEPPMSGAGGNGFMTLFDAKTGKVISLNATGQAPRAVQPDALSAEDLEWGPKASLTPGLFGGWILLLQQFGTRSLGEVLANAIDYAANGHPVDAKIVSDITKARERLRQFPTSAALFLPGGKPPLAGQMLKNPDLARTFRKVVEAERTALAAGRSREEALQAAYDRFYRGDIADEIARFFQANGGLITKEDLAAYRPRLFEPLHTTYRGYDVYSSPATSRGGFEVLMQLNLIEGYDLRRLGHNQPETLHLVAEAIKVAKADVYRYVADPAFTRIPAAAMLSKEYAALRRKMINRKRAMPYPEAGNPEGSPTPAPQQPRRQAFFDERSRGGHTTSFSVVDEFRNAISVTPTLGSAFGTRVVVGRTGLFFNNGMRIGSTSPYPDHVNHVQPGKIPLLNNSPLLVLKDGRFVMAFGSPGGETIGQTQFQMALNVLDFDLPVQEAVEAPRLRLDADPNFYKPGSPITLTVENRLPPSVVQALAARGHKVIIGSAWSIGSMQAILRDQATGTMTAGADPRRTLYAIGY